MNSGVPVESITNATSSNINIRQIGDVKQEPSSLSSSLNNQSSILIVPPNSVYEKLDGFPIFENFANYNLVEDSSSETGASGANLNSTRLDHLSAFVDDPLLSSTCFGFENEMDIGGGAFP